MPATNDGFVNRYDLPGVPDPLLPNDVVNKKYVDRIDTFSIVQPSQSTDITNSTTPIDTALTLPVEAGDSASSYYIHLYGALSGGTSVANIKCGFNCTTTQSIIDFQFTSKNSQPNSIRINNNDGSTGSTPLQTGNLPRIEITGLIVTQGLAGTLTFQFAQQVAENTTLRLMSQSFMSLHRIPPFSP